MKLHSFRLDLPDDNGNVNGGGNLVGPAETASALPAPSEDILSRNLPLIQRQAGRSQPRHCHAHPYPHILTPPALGRSEVSAETPSGSLAVLVMGHPQQQAEQLEMAEGLGVIAGGGDGGGGGRGVHVGLHELMSLVQVRGSGAGAGTAVGGEVAIGLAHFTHAPGPG